MPDPNVNTVDPTQLRIAQGQATLLSSNADSNGAEPTQSSPTGSQLQPPAQNSVQQPMNLAPAAPTVTPAVAPSSNPRLHGFIGSVLSGTLKALAGRPATVYTTDAQGRTVAAPVQPKDTAGKQLARLAMHGLEGLGAGASVPQQKSGAASALAGLGAGYNAATASASAADQAARQKVREDYEAQQRQILNKANVSHLNANTFSLWQNAMQQSLDHDPERATYKAIYDAASDPDSGLQTRIVTPEEAKAMAEADHHTIAKHVFFPIGMKPVLDDNGQPVLNPDGSPKESGQIAAIAANDDGKFTIPQKMADDVKKYSKTAGILDSEGLRAGEEITFNNFARLYGAIQAAKKQAAGAKPELVTVADENATEGEGFGVSKGRKLQRRNPISGDLSDPDATELQNYRKGQADISNKQDKGEVTPRDKYIQDREDQRAKMKQGQEGVTSNLTGEDYLKTLPVPRQGIVRGVGEGRQALPANRKEALSILEDVHQSYPDFDESKGKVWQKTRNEYMGTGATAKALVSANTALAHLQRAFDHSTTDGIYNPLSKDYQALNADVTYITGEVGKAVKGGVISEGEAQHIRESLNGGLTPGLKRERIKETAKLLHDKMDETQTKFSDAAPSSAVKVPVLMHPSAGAAYDYIQNDGKVQSAPSPQSGQAQSAPAGATGKAKGSDGLWHYHDAKGNDLGVAQ